MRTRPHPVSAFSLAIVCCLVCITVFSLTVRTARAQSIAPQKTQAEAAGKKSGSPFVIELYSTRVRFETDGTGERQLEVRVKVTSGAGAEQLHTLAFDYNSSNEKFALAYMRVTKPDGSVADSAPDAIAKMIDDQPAPAVKAAPGFDEIREAHVTVPPIAPGDTLSYEADIKTVKPAAPGEFWYSHNFLSGGTTARDEELQINLPADRLIHLKTAPQFPPVVTSEGQRKIYAWKRMQTENDAAKTAGDATPQPNNKPPDVVLTSFANWEAVGKWFAILESSAAKSGASITAKASELIADKKSDSDKIEALYDFVGKRIRLVAIPLEQLNFHPHDAATILAGAYGDELDKCALLQGLLEAAGFHADVALVSSGAKPEPDVPWPGAFSHAIVTVPGKETLWMDPAPDVLPFRLLLPNFRGKQALVASTAVAPHFMETPQYPPFLSTQTVEVSGRVSSLGRLVARIRYVLRGDNEVALRMAFRRTPEAQWKAVAQTMATLDGLQGEVTDARPGDPTATRDPFTLDFILVNQDFLDWSQAKTILALPLPTFGLPDAPENAAQAIELGSPLDVTTKLTLTLPANDFGQMPAGTGVTRDYAEYRSSYTVQEHLITAERTLRFKASEVPSSRRADYLAFMRAIQSDENQALTVTNIIPGMPADATSSELMESGAAALKTGNNAKALQLFEQVVQLNPKQKNLWRDLGLARLGLGKYEDAATAFRKQLEANPADDTANNLLGVALFSEKKYDEAAAAFKRQIALKPLDPNAYAYLGAVYVDQKHFDAALAELDKAVVLNPDNAAIRIRLGEAYLGAGKTELALGAFDKAAGLSPSPIILNQIAYELAEQGVGLDRAQRYAESAVNATEAELSNVDLRQLTNRELGDTAALPAFWDTLGWVHFHAGRIKEAEELITAAWQLDQRGDEAYHLARIYEKGGEKELAIRTYIQALAADGAPAGARERLATLLGSESGVDARVKRAGAELMRMRTIPLGKAPPSGKAVFLVLLEARPSGPSVREARFLSGDDKLSALGDRFHESKFPAVLPPSTKARLALRGVVECSAKTAACNFVFDRPRDLLVQH